MSKSADSSQVEKKSYPTQETTASISQQLQTGDDHVQNKITPSKSATNVEQDKDEWGNFNGLEDKKVRSTFIRKVYLILSIQLSITFGLIAIVVSIPPIHLSIHSSEGRWLYSTSCITFLIMFTIYAGLVAAIFSIFLVINTQLIMGGKRHEINPEDHVYASLMLYIDIAHIFMYVLAVWY
ncbi:unnamed protein product [Rotaria magnacalcarata]|uniref:Uncharacterized protein n=1 Tax=Rotaria magnacalcarata TaxID=392030 RepID=A0A819RFG3_9BILA|nr:unnamed protein product [Rotaria magnacalcarata]CAF4105454.1 unnamed protein product [Rotaria magnacalcarata]